MPITTKTAAGSFRLGAVAAAAALALAAGSTASAGTDQPRCFGKPATITGSGMITGTAGPT